MVYMLRAPAQVLSDLIHVDVDVLIVDRRRSRTGRNETGENRPAEKINRRSEERSDRTQTWWWFLPAPLCPRKERISPSYKSKERFLNGEFLLLEDFCQIDQSDTDGLSLAMVVPLEII